MLPSSRAISTSVYVKSNTTTNNNTNNNGVVNTSLSLEVLLRRAREKLRKAARSNKKMAPVR